MAVIHVDMDAFYASVEVRDDPGLAGRPVIVGGTPEGRGVVAAASYEARRFGVRSAMPAARARRLCPHAVFLRPRMSHYAAVSRGLRAVFARYTPLVEPLALDEAFLDVTASERLFGPAETVARRIRDDIRAELGLTASVGVAPCKFVAKVASDLDKPDGFVVVPADGVQAFLDPLPVTRLWGIGAVGERTLTRLGIATIAQLRRYPRDTLAAHLGPALGGHVWRLARGDDPRPVVPDHEARSLSHETTFPEDLTDADLLRAHLLGLTEQVAWRLRAAARRARGVQIKVRFADFRTLTRSRTLARATDHTDALWRTARGLLGEVLAGARRPVRLIGMGVGRLDDDTGEQAELFADPRAGALDRVADAARARYGPGVLTRGGSLRRR